MAGGAADCALWIRRVAAMVRSHEYRYKTRLSVRAIAVMFAQQLRSQRDTGMRDSVYDKLLNISRNSL